MKTLKRMPIPENRHNILALPENDAYSVEIFYLMDDDLTAKKIEDISREDIIMRVTPKEYIYPDLTILFLLEDEKDDIEQNFSVDIEEGIVELESIDSYIEAMKMASDTLADIREMLMDLGPQFAH